MHISKSSKRQSTEEYSRKMREQKEQGFEFMLRKSRGEAVQAAQRQEMKLLEQALQESLRIDPTPRDYKDEVVSMTCPREDHD